VRTLIIRREQDLYDNEAISAVYRTGSRSGNAYKKNKFFLDRMVNQPYNTGKDFYR
jgi:hypothetical protein